MATTPTDGLDLTSLDATVQYFCNKGIADSTHRTYQSSLRRFFNFCEQYSILTPFPVSETILCYYASYLTSQSLSPQTIKTYLAGIRHMQITLGLPEPREYSSLPRLRLVQAGIKRVHSQKAPLAIKLRLPITPAILRQIHSLWSARIKDADILMLWAAVTLCFFGFFRSGEITVPTEKAYKPVMHLSWGDIAVDKAEEPKTLQVRLKRSKTDQLGRGAKILVGRTGCTLCPVAAVLGYIAARGNVEGPFFRFKNGNPLTKPLFTKHVRTALQELGLPFQDFAGHSFRIGAATAAARAGIEDSTIKTLGRWSSSAFLAYIRSPPEQLAQMSSILAQS